LITTNPGLPAGWLAAAGVAANTKPPTPSNTQLWRNPLRPVCAVQKV